MKTDIKKPFIEIAGVPVIIRTLLLLEQSAYINELIVVVGEEELATLKRMAAQFGLRKVSRYAPGGQDRQDSVHNGLMAIDKCDVVVVHDGVRPFVSVEELNRVILSAAEHGAATIGTPVKDTIKKIECGVVNETVPRDNLYAVQTPQAFQWSILQEAHLKSRETGFKGTDDAALVEWIGQPVHLEEGSYRNIKLTTPEDLLIAKAFISQES
jgi:2-C-methyl-D-erythritol 4-phosphate cytidylyltransferase